MQRVSWTRVCMVCGLVEQHNLQLQHPSTALLSVVYMYIETHACLLALEGIVQSLVNWYKRDPSVTGTSWCCCASTSRHRNSASEYQESSSLLTSHSVADSVLFVLLFLFVVSAVSCLLVNLACIDEWLQAWMYWCTAALHARLVRGPYTASLHLGSLQLHSSITCFLSTVVLAIMTHGAAYLGTAANAIVCTGCKSSHCSTCVHDVWQ
jgi:hypothetical protein